MKTLIFSLLLLTQVSMSEQIFEVRHIGNADKVVFVTKHYWEADTYVYKTSFWSEGDRVGFWYFNKQYKTGMQKVYFTKNRWEAAVIIYYTPYSWKAGKSPK